MSSLRYQAPGVADEKTIAADEVIAAPNRPNTVFRTGPPYPPVSGQSASAKARTVADRKQGPPDILQQLARVLKDLSIRDPKYNKAFYRNMFDTIDKDGDKALNATEITAFLDLIGQCPWTQGGTPGCYVKAKIGIPYIDVNDNDAVDWEELEPYLPEDQQPDQPPAQTS